jgi:preprotein translocase subunit SecE
LYRKLDVIVFENATTKIMVQSLLPLAIFAGFAFVIYWLVNRPIVADFMIAAEGELKKVTWSTRKELTASTLVVIGVMVVMAAVLFLVDIVLQYFFMWINLIPGGGA